MCGSSVTPGARRSWAWVLTSRSAKDHAKHIHIFRAQTTTRGPTRDLFVQSGWGCRASVGTRSSRSTGRGRGEADATAGSPTRLLAKSGVANGGGSCGCDGGIGARLRRCCSSSCSCCLNRVRCSRSCRSCRRCCRNAMDTTSRHAGRRLRKSKYHFFVRCCGWFHGSVVRCDMIYFVELRLAAVCDSPQ